MAFEMGVRTCRQGRRVVGDFKSGIGAEANATLVYTEGDESRSLGGSTCAPFVDFLGSIRPGSSTVHRTVRACKLSWRNGRNDG